MQAARGGLAPEACLRMVRTLPIESNNPYRSERETRVTVSHHPRYGTTHAWLLDQLLTPEQFHSQQATRDFLVGPDPIGPPLQTRTLEHLHDDLASLCVGL